MKTVLLSLGLLLVVTSVAQARWRLEIGGGAPVNLRTDLTVRQDGYPDIQIRADWETRPFKSPPYYLIRVSRSHGDHAWEIQFLHHKIYLKNTTDEVSHFEISHGFNVFTLNRAFAFRSARLRAGAGLVLAHTESTVRGRGDRGDHGGIFDTGYRIAGPTVLVGASRPVALSARWEIEPEVQFSAGRASVRVADGTANTYNFAMHFLIGLGYLF